MILTLKRYTTYEPATLGTLTVDGAIHSDTLELPWRDRLPAESCIPAGEYPASLVYSTHLKRVTLCILDVPGRNDIMIHSAIHPDGLRGSIALGKRYSRDGLMESRKAVEALEAKVRAALGRGETIRIKILDPERRT